MGFTLSVRKGSTPGGTYVISLLLLVAFLTVSLTGCKVDVAEGDGKWHDFVRDHHQSIDMTGYSLHYIDMGEGTPVVMIHGFADSTYCWHENVKPLLDAGFRVILVDQPGLGESGVPPAGYLYSIENQAEEILKLMDRLAIGRFDVAGHSMGGAIALWLGVYHRERLGHIVAVSPACYDEMGLLMLAIPGMDYMADVFGGRWTVAQGLRDVYYDDTMVDDMLIDEYTRPMEKEGYAFVLSGLCRHFFSDSFEGMTENYGEISTPLLIIWGLKDSWVPPEFGPRLHETVRGSRLIMLEDCGHLPPQEKAAEVNEALCRFLQS